MGVSPLQGRMEIETKKERKKSDTRLVTSNANNLGEGIGTRQHVFHIQLH